MIAHKRIRVVSGKVEEGPLTYNLSGPYSKGQGWTDLRAVDIPPAAVLRVELVHAKGKTVSQILADQIRQHGGNWICFNASYFDQFSGALLGKTHKDGKQIFPDVAGRTEGRPHLYHKDGRFGIGRQDKPDGLTLAVCGVPTLSKGGKAVDPAPAAEMPQTDMIQTQPRTIAGIKPDGTLGLIIVDGRGAYDKGLTSKEAGIMMVHYGYPESINLDGGWSSTIATNNRALLDALEIDKQLRKRQYHVADMGKSQQERVVHHAIAIQFDPGKLLPTYIVDHIPRSTPKNRRPGHKMEPTTITIHNTGNPTSSARNERSWMTNPSNTATASYHIVLDDKETIEVLPLDESAWHAGDGSGMASGNRTSIGIEICESGDYVLAVSRAVDLVAGMLHERGWGVDRLRRHFDWSGKNCPRLMNADGRWSGWDVFKLAVAAKLQQISPPVSQPTGNEVRLVVNGKELEQRGQLQGNTTYVPIRIVSEALGAKVTWEQSSKSAYIDK